MTVAYQLEEAGTRLRRTTIERRPLGPRDVRLDLKFCGICHSDLVAASDKLGGGMFPMVPGHEMVGTVSEVGAAVQGVSVGDTVGVGCIADSCRSCHSCDTGDEHYCETGFTLSFNSKDREGRVNYGGYASDYVVDYDYLVPIPDGADLARMAPLLCGGITVYTPLKRFNVGPGTTLCVLGMGGLGHLAIQFASAMGARVIVASRSEAKRADATRLGAEVALDPDSEDLQTWMGQVDLILDTISNPHDLNRWFSLLRRGGKLCLVGVPTDQLEIFPALIVFGDRALEGSLIGGIADTREMVQFAHSHGLGAEIELIQPDEIETAWHRLHEGERAGQRDVFIDELPGTPDNIRFDGENTFWIAMPSLRASLDSLASLPRLRALLSFLPGAWLEAAAQPASFVVGVNLEGEVVHNLQDQDNPFHYITGVTPCGDMLYLGSLETEGIGILPKP